MELYNVIGISQYVWQQSDIPAYTNRVIQLQNVAPDDVPESPKHVERLMINKDTLYEFVHLVGLLINTFYYVTHGTTLYQVQQWFQESQEAELLVFNILITKRHDYLLCFLHSSASYLHNKS